jgi:hypothetical protein
MEEVAVAAKASVSWARTRGKAGFMNWAGVLLGIALYARQLRALTRCLHWPLLDDIPAVGVPFPPTDKEKHDVDHCRSQEGIDD